MMKARKNQIKFKLFHIGLSRRVALLCLLLFSLHTFAQWPALKPNEVTPTRLFHISRSLNANIVCYDANVVGGKLDKKEPVKIYWFNRTDDPGHTNGLNFLQRKLAFGYKVKKWGEDWAEVSLTATDNLSGRLMKHNGKWAIITQINGQRCRLTEIYCKARNKMSVEYAELRGVSLADGSQQKQILKNIK